MRNVLLLSYYFPPSGGPGVQRVLKFTRYLRDFGWEPGVLTVDAGAYPEHDASLWDDVPDYVTVHRTPAPDPFRLYARLTGQPPSEAVKVGSVRNRKGWKEQLALWIRSNMFIPDARVGWVPYAVARGKKLLERKDIDVILTSGPPHSVHLSGWMLNRTTGIPWVADFRDPWTDINYYHELPHTALAARLDAALERLVLRTATRVITVSPAWRALLAGKVEDDAPFHVVQNGYDAADFEAPAPDLSADAFYLTHVGSLYASRNPTALWQALRQLHEAGQIPRLKVRLVGTVDPQILAELERQGLSGRVKHSRYVTHAKAIAHTRRSHLLLLSIEAFRHNEGMITGKLYEYLASGRPVLGVGPTGGDAGALLRQTGAGRMFPPEDAEGIARFIREHYAAWEAGAPLAGASAEVIQPYSRHAQTSRLADILHHVVGAGVE